MLLKQQQHKFNQLQQENERLKHFLPDSYTEMRMREKQLKERLGRYEQQIVDFENEKKALFETIKEKDDDIRFLKEKYEETNALWHKENVQKQKLEAVIEQQYRESMDLDALRRKAEEDKHFYRSKNQAFKVEIEELVKENKKLSSEKAQMNQRMNSLRQVNKQLTKKIENPNSSAGQAELKLADSQRWAKELEEKLNFTVEKFEE